MNLNVPPHRTAYNQGLSDGRFGSPLDPGDWNGREYQAYLEGHSQGRKDRAAEPERYSRQKEPTVMITELPKGCGLPCYSPNVVEVMGVHRVELTFQVWEYSTSITVDYCSNVSGFEAIDGAIRTAYEALPAVRDCPELLLTRPDGETCQCLDEALDGEDWLKSMLVSARIVGWTAPTLNEVRARNGAGPVDDGDRPWDAP